MRRYSTSIEIAAPPETVWAVMIDVERWPEWTDSIARVERRDHGPLASGSRVVIRQPKLPPATWQVTEVDQGRSFSWISRAPGVLVTARHEIAPAGSGSRATLSIHYGGVLGGLLARLTAGVNDRYLAMEAEGLKRRSEQA